MRTKRDYKSDITTKDALKFGDIWAWLSLFIFGLGNLVRGQVLRFVLFIAAEAAYIWYMIYYGFQSILDMISLGDMASAKEWNEAKSIFEYVYKDNSMLMLLYGVMTLALTVAVVFLMFGSMRSSFAAQRRKEKGVAQPTFWQDIKSLFDGNLHKLLLSWPAIGVLLFTVIPIVFMIFIGFTNFDRNHQPPGNLFDWVGLKNFSTILTMKDYSSAFWSVLAWTLTWAVLATVTNYILGMLLAILINRKGTRLKAMWRFFFVLSIALPAFVSLLTMRTIFNSNGPFNILLQNLGILGKNTLINYWGNATRAKILIVIVNIWVGIPYTMLTTTGILQNIPIELYEAATVDGAGPVKTFFKITLPYMLFVTTPYLITAFVGNINNFNVIFLLSGGGPNLIGPSGAGGTDLLITWLYKLTVTNKDYNLGSVIGLLTFVLMAVFSIAAYRSTGAYKDEEAFSK